MPMVVENTKSGNKSDGVNVLQEKTIKQIEYPTEEEAKEEINVVENYILDSWWVTHWNYKNIENCKDFSWIIITIKFVYNFSFHHLVQ